MKLHPLFQSGCYGEAADLLLEGKRSVRRAHLPSLIGALSFLGRMEEATDLLELEKQAALTRPELVAIRFFLGIGWTRRSDYSRALAFFDANSKEAGKSAIERFFVHQGRAF